jgi:hypothetical protein
MRIRPKLGANCFDAANAASGGKLNKDEIEAAFQRVIDYKQRLQAAGDITNLGEKVASFAEREAERTKVAAAMQKRHAALNIIIGDKLDRQIMGYIADGLTPKQAILTVFEGTPYGIDAGRDSIDKTQGAFEASYMGGMMAQLQKDRPHLINALLDPNLDADITKEMFELRKGGKPGITGNDDAKYVAKVFSDYAELTRTELNKLGASIGKLGGRSVFQTHDDIKMIAAGKDAWIRYVWDRLDMGRTFPDVGDGKEIEAALSDVYDTIITGFPNKPTPRELGQRTNPANLAKSLDKTRVLHFKDAATALEYRDAFGYGNTTSGMIAQLRNSAKLAANMTVLGPNPELMFGKMIDTMKRRIKEDTNLSPADKSAQTNALKSDAGSLRQAMDIATGLVSRPVNVTGAKIANDIRAVQSLAKLGGAVFSSFSDTVTAGLSSQFRGSGFMHGFMAQLNGLRMGRPKGELAELSFLTGEGFDGIIGHIASPHAAQDGPLGVMAGLQEKFFKWNGLSWWTDIQRATVGRVISAEMGMRAKTDFANLPVNYRHVLGLHAIDEMKWKAIQKAEGRIVDGKTYITPDVIRDLPDSVIEPLVKDRMDAARKLTKDDAEFAGHKADIIDQGRRDLELSVLKFFADETSYGVVETDARSRRTSTWGQRPGTMAGEAVRFAMQFKGFPIAFSERVGGRALFGHHKSKNILQKSGHIGTLIAGMTMAGYASMTMKDLLRGYWPPRDISDPKVWAAAFVQGGAAGIYGDYLFGRVNRSGGTFLETTAGPTIGAVANLGDLLLKARDAGLSSEEQVKAGDWINQVTQNTPFINLFYIRPALDYLILNQMKEAAGPGYLRRIEGRRKKDFGQSTLPILGDRQAFN